MIVWIEDGYIKWDNGNYYCYFRDGLWQPPIRVKRLSEVCETWMVLK